MWEKCKLLIGTSFLNKGFLLYNLQAIIHHRFLMARKKKNNKQDGFYSFSALIMENPVKEFCQADLHKFVWKL